MYKTAAGDEAIISYNPQTGGIIGSLHTQDGRSFALEKCGGSYIFEEFDVASFPTEGGETDGGDLVEEGGSGTNTTASTRQGQRTYSVMFYYTPEFAAATPNIEDFLDQVIAETNQGYANSQIPITVTKFCSELSTVSDTNTADLLGDFKTSKGSYDALRNTADVAALLALNFGYCGMASFNTYSNGRTVSVTKKSCALGYYSFGHEIGHNLGATHNVESASNYAYSYGHAHLIEQGSASRGYRTILGYNAPNHGTRVNYYSNPAVTFPTTGTPTGVAGVSDNAAIFMRNIDTLSALGDESAACGGGGGGGAATSGPATTTAAPASCDPANNDWTCCSASSPCDLGQVRRSLKIGSGKIFPYTRATATTTASAPGSWCAATTTAPPGTTEWTAASPPPPQLQQLQQLQPQPPQHQRPPATQQTMTGPAAQPPARVVWAR